MWISLLAVPTLMTFTLDNEGHITYLNVIGLVYSICTAFLWERMMPGYMVRYIKKLIREIDPGCLLSARKRPGKADVAQSGRAHGFP